MNSDLEKIVPPEELLKSPNPKQEAQTSTIAWTVVARNKRVNRDWEQLLSRSPESGHRCYEDLCNKPMERQPGRVFPLKGKKYQGAWEYEVTSGDRVFYVPNPKESKVVVYYAGSHPKGNAPYPP